MKAKNWVLKKKRLNSVSTESRFSSFTRIYDPPLWCFLPLFALMFILNTSYFKIKVLLRDHIHNGVFTRVLVSCPHKLGILCLNSVQGLFLMYNNSALWMTKHEPLLSIWLVAFRGKHQLLLKEFNGYIKTVISGKGHTSSVFVIWYWCIQNW